MSGDLLALGVGTLLAVGAIAFVLWPLFAETQRGPTIPRAERPSEDSAIVALREIEFDRATGKLSDTDYADLRAQYGERALAELRSSESSASTGEPLDEIEAAVRRYRATHRECPTCGLRPEPDAIYCSTCGAFLDSSCPVCAAEIVEPAARYCSTCGADLLRHAAAHAAGAR